MKARTKNEGPLLEAVLVMLDTASRNTARKIIKKGRVLVEGKVQIRPDFKVLTGQSLEISPRGWEPPLFTILFEDDHLVAVDKPAGLLSISTRKEHHKTLYRMVSSYVKESSGGRSKIFIVHRLDRDVSGVMLFARDDSTKRQLQKGWETAEKIYHAVVEGRLPADEGTVKNWLRENTFLRVYVCDSKAKDAREAVTHYRVIKGGARRSTVEVRIETGRKHQIRVHLAELGCPIVGDNMYGKGSPDEDLALHAQSLSFDHPVTGRRVTVVSPLPERFRGL